MADRKEDLENNEVVENDDFIVETDDEIENEEPIENPEGSEATDPEIDPEEEADDEEDRVVTIGDEAPESGEESQETPGWVKKVRKKNREQEREIKQLKKQLLERNEPAEAAVEVGEKPTLKSCKFNDANYEKELLAWSERKKLADAETAKRKQKGQEVQEAWKAKQENYVKLKQKHGFKDYAEAEATVQDVFSVSQQGVMVQGADDPALLVYALGKNPKKLAELAKIKDPVTFAFKVAKLEGQLKVSSKKAPTPEKRVTGGRTGSKAADATLEKLRLKAAKTGDYTEVSRYKKKLRGN